MSGVPVVVMQVVRAGMIPKGGTGRLLQQRSTTGMIGK
jgi:hypothetical protein